MINRFFTSFIITLISISAISQEKEIVFDELDPSAPSKAAFYSAVLPGLGQGYNKKYWKIPIVYAAIGTSIYSYDFNQKKFDERKNKNGVDISALLLNKEYITNILSTKQIDNVESYTEHLFREINNFNESFNDLLTPCIIVRAIISLPVANIP